jgi:hypothetical protein
MTKSLNPCVHVEKCETSVPARHGVAWLSHWPLFLQNVSNKILRYRVIQYPQRLERGDGVFDFWLQINNGSPSKRGSIIPDNTLQYCPLSSDSSSHS